jgi:hypothetical protein
VGHDLFWFGDFEDFDEAMLELDDAIMRAPGMTVARANGEAGARLKLAGRVEVADGVHDMVEAVRHQ